MTTSTNTIYDCPKCRERIVGKTPVKVEDEHKVLELIEQHNKLFHTPMNQLEQIKQDIFLDYKNAYTGILDDKTIEDSAKYLLGLVEKAYLAGQEAERERIEKEFKRGAQKLVQVPGTIRENGEWCICGVWKQYGVTDNHHCTGYRVTC